MTLVELSTTRDCHSCDEARAVLDRVLQEHLFTLREYVLVPGDERCEEYRELFPVVRIDGMQAFTRRISERLLRIKLQQHAGHLIAGKSDADEDSMPGKP